MEQERRYIAVDLGAESGRVMSGTVGGKKVGLEEVYRFSNGPIKEGASLRWDFDKLFSEVTSGIVKAIKRSDGEVSGIGVDSWGVDYGLLGGDGWLLEKPYHYRDNRTDGMLEKAFQLMAKRDIYENSGVQFMQINTVYQLLSMRLTRPEVLARAKKLIFMADLVSYRLCGRAYAEYSLASTSGLMDMRTGQWSKGIFEKFGLPMNIMPEVVQPGTIVGELKSELCEEFGCKPINIIAVGSHDTADAVAAVPAQSERWAYLSSGTWSLMGVEAPKAIINGNSLKYSFTNEGGVENTIRFLKNITGLWLVQECRRQWQREGVDLSYVDLSAMAEKAEAFAGYIDPDYSGFLSPGDMPARVNNFLAETGQKIINDKGQMARLILESLAFKYRSVAEAIEDITGEAIEILHIVGGGMRNELLCQFTANAIGKKVIAGPIEATATGNVLMQAKAAGQIKSLGELRGIVRDSFELKEYRPQDSKLWDERYEKIKSR
ncbi:MAG: rhamnulokinase [Planctomycetota bacterium]|nr:MAG: rhamnulokinase [Planctomycetota bacterium]